MCRTICFPPCSCLCGNYILHLGLHIVFLCFGVALHMITCLPPLFCQAWKCRLQGQPKEQETLWKKYRRTSEDFRFPHGKRALGRRHGSRPSQQQGSCDPDLVGKENGKLHCNPYPWKDQRSGHCCHVQPQENVLRTFQQCVQNYYSR